MRLSTERIKALQDLLKEQFGLVYTDEEAQQAGLAIMRFVVAKQQRANKLTISEESKYVKDQKKQKDDQNQNTEQ